MLMLSYYYVFMFKLMASKYKKKTAKSENIVVPVVCHTN